MQAKSNDNAKGTSEIDMTRGALLPKLALFIAPLMLSNILQLSFNAADLIVVGKFLGDVPLAAVGSNNALIAFVVCVLGGLTTGISVLVARYFGAKNEIELQKTIQTSLITTVVASLLVGAFGVVFSVPILRLTRVPAEALSLAAVYLKIYFAGVPALALFNAASAILRAVGDTRKPLYFLSIAGVLNVALNVALIVVFHWGVSGVAVATVVSEIVSAALTLRYLVLSTAPYRVELRRPTFDRKTFAELLRVGLPAGIQSSLFSISNMLIQGAINTLGAAAMAGNAAGASIEYFVYYAQDAIGQAALASVSQNVGAGNFARTKRSVSACVFLEALVCGALMAFVYVFRVDLLRLYAADPAAIDAGSQRLTIFAIFYILNGLMNMAPFALRGYGISVAPMVISFFAICVFRSIWIALAFPKSPTLTTVFLSYPISWTVACVALAVCYYSCRKRAFDRLAPTAALSEAK